MKKTLGILVILAMMLSMLPFSSSAAGPTLIWDFGADSDMESKMGSKSGANALTYTAEDFYEVFTATGNDPYVSVDTAVDSVDSILWCKIRVKNDSPATAIELFAHTNGRDLTGSECTHVEIEPNKGEWATYTCYIPDANLATVNAYKDPQYAITEFYWAGTVEWVRLDPMWQEGDDGSDAGGNMSDGDTICIDYIAFFASEEDMNAYYGTNEEAPAAETEAPAAETDAAAAETEAPAADATPATPAAQTADVIAISVAAAVMALGIGYIASKKK